MALHCPALVVVVVLADDASAASTGATLVELLNDERLAAVYATDGSVTDATAAEVADRLGLPPPGRATADNGATHDIADLHRGETVLLLVRAPGTGRDGWWAQAVAQSIAGPDPHACRTGPTGDPRSGLVEIVRLEVGDDGWQVVSAGSP